MAERLDWAEVSPVYLELAARCVVASGGFTTPSEYANAVLDAAEVLFVEHRRRTDDYRSARADRLKPETPRRP